MPNEPQSTGRWLIWSPADARAAIEAAKGHGVPVTAEQVDRGRIVRPRALKLRLAAMTFGAIAAGLVLGAAPARADDHTAQYTRDNAVAFCTVLDRQPTDAGVETVLGTIHEAGFSSADTATIVHDVVMVFCPRNVPVLDAFIRDYTVPPRVVIA